MPEGRKEKEFKKELWSVGHGKRKKRKGIFG